MKIKKISKIVIAGMLSLSVPQISNVYAGQKKGSTNGYSKRSTFATCYKGILDPLISKYQALPPRSSERKQLVAHTVDTLLAAGCPEDKDRLYERVRIYFDNNRFTPPERLIAPPVQQVVAIVQIFTPVPFAPAPLAPEPLAPSPLPYAPFDIGGIPDRLISDASQPQG
jgi:hypothetical protein